jgi:single-stranded-DNA-specific exonuclease
MQKHWKLLPTDESAVEQLQKELGIDPLFCRLLVQRGIFTRESARLFFRPSLENLHDPFLMCDMEKAVIRLEKAIDSNEKILLYGDYDVDGTTCVALMWSFLKNFHQNLDYYIPDRHREGYGVSLQSVDYAQKNEISLVIAMDCGIKAHEAVTKASKIGIDFIICDHHLPEGNVPEAVAVLDPKRNDCAYPFKELSGCGVAFKLAQAFCQKKGLGFELLEPLLDLLVVSIACDIVPIFDENRILAHFGLERLNKHPRIGLRALITRSNRAIPLTISDLVFGIGPFINAAGRLGDARDAVKLMLAEDTPTAFERADFLESQNKARRLVDSQTADAARAKFIESENWESRKSIVLFDQNWHKGIIGIVASRMAETFHRPTIIFTESEGRAVGSARSAGGFDLYEAIKKCENLLISFGGHAHAAGMQIQFDKIAAFSEKFEEMVRENYRPEMVNPIIEICTELDFEGITPKFWRILRQFAPFGPGNKNPIFSTKNVEDTGASRDLGRGHLKLSLRQNGHRFGGVGFDLGAKLELVKSLQPLQITYNIREETWRGEQFLQLQVKDIKNA